MPLAAGVTALATKIGNYLRDSVTPRLVPRGGAGGQQLVKKSATDNDVEWRYPPARPVPVYFSAADGNLANGQQIFPIPGGYAVGSVSVIFDGIDLYKDAFVATNGTSVQILNPPVETTDKIKIVVTPA